MKKEDLNCGNIIELRDGKRYIQTCIEGYEFIRLDYINSKSTSFFPLNEFDDDLKGSHSGLDIVKVYEDYTLKKVLWERKEKPKLTEDEKAILRNIDKKYKWIARDKIDESMLCIFIDKPKKEALYWFSDNYVSLGALKHLFQFITYEDEEPTLIEDLLKN